VNIRLALLGGQTSSDIERGTNRVSIFGAALVAYKIFFGRFWSALRLLLLPMLAAGLVLYISLSAYLAELLLFLETQSSRVASLALGSLAAGIFLSLFCYAIAVGSIGKLALGKEPRGAWLHFRADRQEWRLYAAYLRFLLLISLVVLSAYLLATYLAPLFAVPRIVAIWTLGMASAMAVFWLTVRVGFLIAPVVAGSEGPVLRRALAESGQDFWRNAGLIVLLLVPGTLVQIAGEYVLRIGLGAPPLTGNLALADYVQVMGRTLAGFLVVVSLSSFVTVGLLTLGAMGAYQTHRLRDASKRGQERSAAVDSNLSYSVRAEGLPE